MIDYEKANKLLGDMQFLLDYARDVLEQAEEAASIYPVAEDDLVRTRGLVLSLTKVAQNMMVTNEWPEREANTLVGALAAVEDRILGFGALQ